MLDFGFHNMDCMKGMKEFPDNYFDLAIVDPPYGLGIGHPVGNSVTIIGGGAVDHSEVKNCTVYGASTKALANQNFIIRSMIARHRTVSTLRNYSECQKRK